MFNCAVMLTIFPISPLLNMDTTLFFLHFVPPLLKWLLTIVISPFVAYSISLKAFVQSLVEFFSSFVLFLLSLLSLSSLHIVWIKVDIFQLWCMLWKFESCRVNCRIVIVFQHKLTSSVLLILKLFASNSSLFKAILLFNIKGLGVVQKWRKPSL